MTTRGSEVGVGGLVEAANIRLSELSEEGYRFLANIFPPAYAFESQDEQIDELKRSRGVSQVTTIDDVIYTMLIGNTSREFLEMNGHGAVFALMGDE
ncbi:MAG TPA: hypothetical protein VIH90_00520 [Candidatus Saccharimonadales bacterium]